MRIFVLATTIVLLSTSTGESQTRRRKSTFVNPLRHLDSEYLQKDLELTEKQLKRIQQIKLQLEGTAALQREEIQKELGLSKGQVKKVNALFDEHYRRRDAVLKEFRKDRDEGLKKYRAISAEYKTLGDKAFEMLTQSQKRRWEKLIGKPFDSRKLYGRPARKKRPDV